MGKQAYEAVWQMLRHRAVDVAEMCADEIIVCCEHEPVYTTGKRGIDNRLGAELPAPVVYSDRGGEMTFHGPGQLMIYPVIDLRRRRIGVKQYVHMLEQSCINMLKDLGVDTARRCGFPGVWVGQNKIAALGIRIARGVAYHGMALNVDVEAEWFAAINPCGMQSGVVNLADFADTPPLSDLAERWQCCLNDLLQAQ